MALKKFRTTFLLVLLFAALLAFVYFFERDREVRKDRDLEEQTYDLVNFDKSQVKEIVFEQTDKKTKVIRENDDWKIIEPITYKARTNKIDETLDKINELIATQEIVSDDLVEFGLDKPIIKITLVMQDDSHLEVILGDKNLQETSLYIKTSLSNNIYLTNTLIETQLKLDEEILKED